MIEDDTIKLLRVCDSGVKMGISSIQDVLGEKGSGSLDEILHKSMEEHEKLDREIQKILGEYHDDGKDPNPVVKGMSWVKTNMKLAMDHSDAAIADLMTDGCNMGVKSLRKYLNQYPAAEKRVKKIAEDLIHTEETMTKEMQQYL